MDLGHLLRLESKPDQEDRGAKGKGLHPPKRDNWAPEEKQMLLTKTL